jgi:S-adenosylmethionine-diacylgycerolhomoserine-N-methlytransferase
MSIANDLRVLYHLAVSPIQGATHAERLESFYGGQAGDYDAFRRRLLHGREDLCAKVQAVPEGGVWVDMGGGTGHNLEFFGERITLLDKVYVVDLAPSLLRVARDRVRAHGWDHVETVEADATRFTPTHGAADLVTFSYSLTMIPDWFAAVENAWRMLRPGGLLGVVDFHVSRKHPDPGFARHGWATRTLWPAWFANDNVFLSPDHVPFLHRRFEPVHFEERRAPVPFLPGLRVPYYLFVGRKPA